MKKWMRIIAALVLCLVLTGCGRVPGNTVFSGQDLYGRRIGVLRGSAMESFVEADYFKEYTARGTTFLVYESREELAAALKGGLCDCVITDEMTAGKIARPGSGLDILDDIFIVEKYSIITARENVNLYEDLCDALWQLKDDGVVQDIVKGYLLRNGYQYESELDEENITGTITLAVEKDFPPYSYENGDTVTGMDVDIARAICDQLGIGLNIIAVPRGDAAEAIRNGTADFSMARWTATEKDKELVAFTEDYYACDQVIVIRK